MGLVGRLCEREVDGGLTLGDRAAAQEPDHGGVLEENVGCAHLCCGLWCVWSFEETVCSGEEVRVRARECPVFFY